MEVHLAEGWHPLSTLVAPSAPPVVQGSVSPGYFPTAPEPERVTKRQGKAPRNRGAHKRAMRRQREQESLAAKAHQAAEKGFPTKSKMPAPVPSKAPDCTCWHGAIAHGDRGCTRYDCHCKANAASSRARW